MSSNRNLYVCDYDKYHLLETIRLLFNVMCFGFIFKIKRKLSEPYLVPLICLFVQNVALTFYVRCV